MLESLSVSCKYAPNGCKQMLKQTEIETYEKDGCNYKPFRCPVENCNYEGSNVTLPVHLAEEHEVPRVALNSISGAGFKMDISDDHVMVKGDQETDLLFVDHRETHEFLESPTLLIFFFTSFGASYKSYNLKVKLCSSPSLSYSMVGACAINLLYHWQNSSFKRDHLLLPWFRSGPKRIENRPVEVLFTLSPTDDLLDKDDN